MKVKISTPVTYAVADLSCEDAVKAFRKMNEILMGISMKAVEQAGNQPQAKHEPEVNVMESVPVTEPELQDQPAELTVSQAQEEPDDQERTDQPVKISAKGFQYIRCPECGEERGFYTSDPVTEAICRKCSHVITYTERLRTVWLHCECGSGYHYLTNIQDGMFEMPCLSCKRPVVVERNKKKSVYTTIQ